jgi:dTDP-4-amino-4,6-dideoxygalactose transaminase
MRIPFLDVGESYKELKPEIDEAVTRVLDSGRYVKGPEVDAFERAFSSFLDTEHTIGVSNGLDGLRIALQAVGVKGGDEVIVPSNTFIATWLAVTHCSATIVPIEPDAETYNLDPLRLEALITRKTKAIVVVHLYGLPAELDLIHDIARCYRIPVIEDAAQAHGSTYNGKRIGGHSDLVVWSFYPGKNLGAFGDGGAVTTNDATLALKIRVLADYGSKEKYVHEIVGQNSRLDAIQASILAIKLKYLEEWNKRRKVIADIYQNQIKNHQVMLPRVPSHITPSWHLFVVRHSKRDELKQALYRKGIEAMIHYPIIPSRQGAYSHLFSNDAFPVAEDIASSILSLPIGPHLSTAQAREVVGVVNQFK